VRKHAQLELIKMLQHKNVLLVQKNAINVMTLPNVLFARRTTSYSKEDADLLALAVILDPTENVFHVILKDAKFALTKKFAQNVTNHYS
jgi:hypothetical protein